MFSSGDRPTAQYRVNHYCQKTLQEARFLFDSALWPFVRHSHVRRRVDVSSFKSRLCRVPCRILYVGYGDRDASGVIRDRYSEANLRPALREFGSVDELLVSVPRDWDSNEWHAERTRFNDTLVRTAKLGYELVIGQMWGWFVEPSSLDCIRAAGSTVVNYSWDDEASLIGRKLSYGWSGTFPIALASDLMLSSSTRAVRRYRSLGCRAYFWPEAANPDPDAETEECRFDVSFIGARYGARPLIVDSLRRAGIDLHVFGPGWAHGAVSATEMKTIIRLSRINLGFSSIGHMTSGSCLKGRDFEVPMLGGLSLTGASRDLAYCYEVGAEVECYRNLGECIEKIRWLLANPSKAREIRNAGHARARRDHTWNARLKQMFAWINDGSLPASK